MNEDRKASADFEFPFASFLSALAAAGSLPADLMVTSWAFLKPSFLSRVFPGTSLLQQRVVSRNGEKAEKRRPVGL